MNCPEKMGSQQEAFSLLEDAWAIADVCKSIYLGELIPIWHKKTEAARKEYEKSFECSPKARQDSHARWQKIYSETKRKRGKCSSRLSSLREEELDKILLLGPLSEEDMEKVRAFHKRANRVFTYFKTIRRTAA